MLRTLNQIAMSASALALVVAFFNRNEIPGAIDFHPRLADEPRQRPLEKRPFTVPYAGVEYRVEPLYDYELYGLVVSYRQHDGKDSMHRWSNDHLNVADVCVVWSDTAFSPTLRELDFWNGVFTCNFEMSDDAAWQSIRSEQIANNHLISDVDVIRDRVDDVRVGDQVRVRGWLAAYGSGRNRRGTSTTREDSGNGACETIYVSDFDVVKPAPGYWRTGLYASLVVLALALIVHFHLPYRPYA